MAEESRTKKTLLNARVNLTYILISVFIAFFSRKIFIDSLGTEFMGLTSTLQSLLGFLNLAELGVGAAISVNLFKPLANKDHKAINEIISVMAYMYRRIGLLILSAGIILSFFLPLIFKKSEISISIVFFAYYAFLISSLLTYFFTYKATLLTADQRNYVVTKYSQAANVVKLLIQMAVAYYWHSPYYWVAIELAFGILYCFILENRIRKIYPWFKSTPGDGNLLLGNYPNVKKSMKQVFFHKIAGFATTQATPLVIYGYLSLTTVLYYTNYITVIQKLSLFVNALLGSADASVGNLVASKPIKEQMKVYDEMTSLRFFIAGLYVFMLYNLINPFISLWLGSEYLFSRLTVILLMLDVFISQYRGSTDQFLYGYGLFKDIWAPYAEAAIFLGGSIILTPHWGINGVIFSLMLSKNIISGIWKPYFLFKDGFRLSFTIYLKLFVKECTILCISYLIAILILHNIRLHMDNFLNWTISAFIIGSIYLTINATMMYFFAPGFKFTIHRLKSAILKN